MNEQELKARIDDLEMQLNNKDVEIVSYLDKIEGLEERIMKLEMLVPDQDLEVLEDSELDSKTRLSQRFKEQEEEIRDLKNRMGYLRKEKIQLQKRLETLAKQDGNNRESTVIRIEEKKPPLDALVKDLQARINKQKIIIKNLKEDKPNLAKYEDNLRHKQERIAELKQKVSEKEASLKEKEEKLEQLKGQLSKSQKKKHFGSKKKPSDTNGALFSGLTGELQEKLNRSKIEIRNLQEKLREYKGQKLPENEEKLKEQLDNQNELINELQSKLDEEREILENKIQKFETMKEREKEYHSRCEDLESKLEVKDQQIVELEKEIADLKTEIKETSEVEEDSYTEIRINELKDLIEELKKQTTQQRIEIKQLRNKK